ncbi:hypothetical protein [Arthrobacter zhaoguopingii]|uniref:hypothetical protein n=1 Tax=Arthrobacter zhaoguopingii TaxID=2681491 RepID=UPI001356939C|nr:hypothetical protein [Arthrobacter zhaoguopingii]
MPAWTAAPQNRLAAAAAHVRAWDPDLLRAVLVSLAAVAWLLAPGGRAWDPFQSGPPLPGPTLLLPAAGALWIRVLIDLALCVYVLYQWLPSQRRKERQRRLGWTLASAFVLLIAIRLSGPEELQTLAAAIVVLLLGVLLTTLATLHRYPAEGRIEGAAVDVPLGLLLGWTIIETAVHAAALADRQGTDLFDLGAQTWALIAVGVVTVGTAVLCSMGRGHLSVALAVVWGLIWLLFDRLFGEPASAPVAFAAGLAVFLLLITAGSRRHRVDHERRRRLRALQDAARPPLNLAG